MSSYISITISVKIREKDLVKNRDYLFKLKTFTNLSLNDNFLAHVISVNIIIVQIKNILNKIFIVLKHFRVKTLIDYVKEKYYVVFSKSAYLAVKFYHNQPLNQIQGLRIKLSDVDCSHFIFFVKFLSIFLFSLAFKSSLNRRLFNHLSYCKHIISSQSLIDQFEAILLYAFNKFNFKFN